MGELCPRVGTAKGGDSVGVTEQVAENVDVVDTHTEQLQLVVLPQKFLPMGNGAHLYGRQHRLAQQPALQNKLQRPHGLVPAHIGVYRDFDPAFLSEHRDFAGMRQGHRDRFLAEYPFNIWAFASFAHNVELQMGRYGYINDFEAVVFQ
jgi:hypothetical protein